MKILSYYDTEIRQLRIFGETTRTNGAMEASTVMRVIFECIAQRVDGSGKRYRTTRWSTVHCITNL